MIRDLGGSVVDNSTTVGGTTYTWIQDNGNSASLLLGFILDGLPVYGPAVSGDNHTYSGSSTPSIDSYNGHTHTTAEFQSGSGIYHYHVKTGNVGGTSSNVFWITNEKYFGKLQAVKLILWNKLGELAKRLNMRVKKRIMAMQKKHSKLFKFLGIGFKQSGPYVTRRYSLIKKKKTSNTNKPSKGDIFIDVELFALDLNIRFLSAKTGKIEDFNMGGILDIPFMRPQEFGYEVALTKRRGMTYRDVLTGRLINDKRILVASKEFLIEDIYLMHKLRLRPEKKEKDRQRLVRLAQLFDKRIKSSNSMDDVFRRISPKIVTKSRVPRKPVKISMNAAKKVDPHKYKNFTTKPMNDRLSKQIVHGLKPVVKNTNVEEYKKSSGK